MRPHSSSDHPVVVIGAGPAGLTAAHELVRHGRRPVVLEKLDKVGGLARTECYRGFHFDMGGHRFFTKVTEVQELWQQILGDEFLRRPRLSRILYRGRFFQYPLRPLNAMVGLGPWQALLIGLSYLRWRLFPYRREDTFEQWVTNRFGRRLFFAFFKNYTEKVWGIPCSELRAEWAAQRIKDLSLRTALVAMFVKPGARIRTLIEEFHYPRRGPGMMWTAVGEVVERAGGEVRLNRDVAELHWHGTRVEYVVVDGPAGPERVAGSHFVSAMPLTELMAKLVPPAPGEVQAAAKHLTYRAFITVGLILDRPDVFPDNWIYVHSPDVKVGRIQNFKNWSPDMVPDPGKTSLGLEYFATQGDALWSMPDAELIELGKCELDRMGLAAYADVEDGCVFRMPHAYPVYDSSYRDALATVRGFVQGLENLQTIGRNGLHRYNNQDHAMLTGLLAARNVIEGGTRDLWRVNADQEYLEEVSVGRTEEERITADAVERAAGRVFLRLDRAAFGVACGTVLGAWVALLTLVTELGGGPAVQVLGLLGQYFPGYNVSLSGSALGLAYGFLTGGVLGWSFATLRNAVLFLAIAVAHGRVDREMLGKVFDYV